MTACDNFGLNDEKGFGKLIVSKAYLEEDGSEVTSGTVKVDGKEAGFGEEIVLAKGTYRVTITDESGNTTTEEGIVIKVAETTILDNVKLAKPLYNALRFIFDPATFGGNTVSYPEQINEVYLKGNVNSDDWSRLEVMTRNEDGTWSVIIPAVTDEYLEFGFVYWLDTDGDGVSDEPDGEWGVWAGDNPATRGNYTVEAARADGIVEDVIGMKLIFDPATFGGNTVENPGQINEVYVKGSITSTDWSRLDALTRNEDGTWSVIVPAVDDYTLEFGFVYWLDTDGDGVSDDPADERGHWAGGNPATGGNYNNY
ncbi:MAG: hypothetical protein WBK86_02000, partial [Halanaerobiales bacterium]